MSALTDRELWRVARALYDACGSTKAWAFWYNPSLQRPVIYWSHCVIKQGMPYSPITTLLQDLMHIHGKDIVRQGHLYVSYKQTPTEMCRGMADFLRLQIRVVNNPAHNPVQQQVPQIHGNKLNPPKKRKLNGPPLYADARSNLFVKIDPERVLKREELKKFRARPLGPGPNFQNLGGETKESGFRTVHRIYMMLAFALVAARTSNVEGKGHNIGAVIVAPSGEVIGWGVNTKWTNYTFHAEVNAIQSYFRLSGGKAIPSGSRIYTTLKPCKMCAGMIRRACQVDGEIKVYYGQVDTGNHAGNTALDVIPNIQQQLGAGDAKALTIYSTGVYNNINKQVPATTNLGQTLESRRELEVWKINQIRSVFLRSHDALSLFNKTLQSVVRKMDKYSLVPSNENVLKVMNHLLPFIRGHRLNVYKGGNTNEVALRNSRLGIGTGKMLVGVQPLQLEVDDLSQILYDDD